MNEKIDTIKNVALDMIQVLDEENKEDKQRKISTLFNLIDLLNYIQTPDIDEDIMNDLMNGLL